MSTQAIGPNQTSVAAGELAAAARVRELQQLIEKARGVSSGASQSATVAAVTGEAAPTAFAAALKAAGASTAALPVAQAGGAGSSSAYDPMIEQAALRNGLDPALLYGLIQQESGFNPDAQSSAGASGLTQLMPATAASLGVTDPLDPEQSIEGGARYLSRLMGEFAGNTSEALAAYNAGPAAVSRYGGVPPYGETESYVSKVLGYAESYRLEHPATTSGVSA